MTGWPLILLLVVAFACDPAYAQATRYRRGSSEEVSRALDQLEQSKASQTQLDDREKYLAQNEGYYVQSSKKKGVFDRELTAEFGFEEYKYDYEETKEGEHFIDYSGRFHGLYGALTLHSGPDSIYESMVLNFFALEARAAIAKLDYNGSVGDGLGFSAPLQFSKVPDFVIETRALAGKDFNWKDGRFTPYSGFGFRFLHDDPSDTEAVIDYYGSAVVVNGYKRTSEYYYLPLGVDFVQSLGPTLRMGARMEYDHLFYGIQKSYMETAVGTPVENRQDKGMGVRASVSLEKDFRYWGLRLEPFIRYWDLRDSHWTPTEVCVPGTPCMGAVEPQNTTREIGMRVGVSF